VAEGGKEKRVGGDEEAVNGERKVLSCSLARREDESPSLSLSLSLSLSHSLLHPSPSF